MVRPGMTDVTRHAAVKMLWRDKSTVMTGTGVYEGIWFPCQWTDTVLAWCERMRSFGFRGSGKPLYLLASLRDHQHHDCQRSHKVFKDGSSMQLLRIYLFRQRGMQKNYLLLSCTYKKKEKNFRKEILREIILLLFVLPRRRLTQLGQDEILCAQLFSCIYMNACNPPSPPPPRHLSSCMPVPKAQELCFFNFILYFTRCPSYSDIPAGCQLVTDPQDSCCQVPDCPGQPNTSNNTIIIKGPIGTISGSSLPPNHRGPLTRNSQCMLNKLLFCIFLSIWQA